MDLRFLLYRPAPCPRRLLCPACYSPGEDAFNIGITYTSHTGHQELFSIRVIRRGLPLSHVEKLLSAVLLRLELRGLQS